MTLKIETHIQCPKNWNEFLQTVPTGNIYNTYEYSKYVDKRIGWKPIFFRITDSSGQIYLQCIVFEEKINIKRFRNILSKGFSVFQKTWRWNYGPISTSNEASNLFFNFLLKSKKNLIGTTHPLSNLIPPMSKKSWATLLIDLNKSKEELLSKFDKHSAQKNIRRSIDRGVTVEEIDESSLIEYHLLLNKTRKQSGSKEFDFGFTLDFWKFLKPVGYSGFLARKNGIVIGGISFSFFNNYITELGVARSEQDFNEKLYSQDLIKWNIIEWGKSNNCYFYDLSGFNPNPISSKERGIMQYKKKWGGELKNYWVINHNSI